MKVPPKRKGNWAEFSCPRVPHCPASMKVPPKRKGNLERVKAENKSKCLNESPSQKEGKCCLPRWLLLAITCLNESPSQKEGKSDSQYGRNSLMLGLNESPSQKEGKFNTYGQDIYDRLNRLNESPSQKEGKYPRDSRPPPLHPPQ